MNKLNLPTESDTSEVKCSRISVSFPPELYKELDKIARKRKVSLAWVVRDASEKYIASQDPLFA